MKGTSHDSFLTSLFLLNTQTLDRQIGNTIEDIRSRVRASRGEVTVSTESTVCGTVMQGVQRFLTSLSLPDSVFHVRHSVFRACPAVLIVL